MKLYETGFLLAPNLTDDESEKIIQQMAEVVAQKNGRMTKIDRWGKRLIRSGNSERPATFSSITKGPRTFPTSSSGASNKWTPSFAT
jgi:L-asparaginase II